ncbi:unnamed protein product [Boreogadus saida]
MSFHLIKFANGDIAVVPENWCDDGMVYWPKYKNTERAKRAAANSETPESNWPKYDIMVIRTCDNYKDACRLLEKYQTGCNTTDLQSEAEQECGPPAKRLRKAVHHFGDSDESEDGGQLHWQTPTSRRGPGSSSRVSPRLEENCLAPHHGAGPQQPLPKQLFTLRVTQGTAVPPLLPPPPPPPTSTLSLRPTEEPSSIPAIGPTWRGGRMNESIPCSAAELHILNLLETIKQQQDQLVAKVNYLCSKMNCTPGPEVEMPENINLPLEHLEAVEAFEVFLKEPSNHPARQRIIASLATIGGHDVKRVTWNILGRLYSDDVSHQINWKGVNHKKAFSQMSAKSLLFSVVRKNSLTKSVTDAEVTKHTIRWFNLAMDRATKRRGGVRPPTCPSQP